MAQKEKTQKEQALEKLASFLQRNRIVFIVLIAVLAAAIIFFAVYTEVKRSIVEKSTLRSESVELDYEAWKAETDEGKRTAKETEMFAAIDSILDKYPNTYAAQRCLFIKGLVYWDKKDWENAAASFTSIADRFPESYLSPISLVNAAVAQEEKGMLEESAALYDRILKEYKTSFPDLGRVLFSLGRVNEALGKPEEALASYNELVDNYAGNSWTNLARNRIIALKIESR